MLSAILIDDEDRSLNSLKHKILDNCPEIKIVAACDTPSEGLNNIEKLLPDIVFLDIEMPIMSGFTLLQKLKYRNFELIFVTAYDHYAVRAIKFSAMDYLVKPVEIDELKKAVARVIEKKLNTPNQRLELLLENIAGRKKEFRRIAISSWEGLQFIKLDNIVYLESTCNYTNVFVADGKKYLSSRTLKDYEELLPADTFIRIHNSYIINKSYVEKYIRGEGGQVVLEGNTTLDVSKRKKAHFLRIISK